MGRRAKGSNHARKLVTPSASPQPPPTRIPAPWYPAYVRLESSTRSSHNRPSQVTTSLVGDDPRSGNSVILASDMELASWEDAATDPVQARICPDPECGVEGCLVGSWVVLRRVDGAIELGPHPDWDPADDWSRTEEAPPVWMFERGLARIPEADWDRLTGGFRALPLAAHIAHEPTERTGDEPAQ